MKERSGREKRIQISLCLYAICAVVVCGLALWLMVASLGRVDGKIKTSPGAPEALVSIGSPRSQLELKRTFSQMSHSYFENGRNVYEPITQGHRELIAERLAKGESLSLSVEEILFIISDTVAAYNEYDVIKLMGRNGDAYTSVYPERGTVNGYEPHHISATNRVNDIIGVVIYRIISLSSPDRYTETTEEYIYIPYSPTKDNGEKTFVIKKPGIDGGEAAVTFRTEKNSEVTVFPYPSELTECNSKMIHDSVRRISSSEAALLRSKGYDPEDFRNVTPDYWYDLTTRRLFLHGDRVLLVNAEADTLVYLLPEGQIFTSSAITVDGSSTAIYFTSSNGNGSALWSFEESFGVKKLYESDVPYLGIYESYEDESVELYETDKIENTKYTILLVRRGECLWKNK